MKKKILVLCTGNSCRSIMGEAIINHFVGDAYQAFSAGSAPVGFVHPQALNTLASHGIVMKGAQSQSWDAFEDVGFDLIITVCDNAAGEVCPAYLGLVKKKHWCTSDPAKVVGSEDEVKAAFEQTYVFLKQKVLQELR